MAIYIKDGELYNSEHGIEHDGFTTYNATEEMITGWGYEPYEYIPTPRDLALKERDDIQNRIYDTERQLSETDYIALKYIEGYDCDTLYPGWKQQRKELRDLINELEEELENLVIPDPEPIINEDSSDSSNSDYSDSSDFEYEEESESSESEEEDANNLEEE